MISTDIDDLIFYLENESSLYKFTDSQYDLLMDALVFYKEMQVI